MSYMNYMQLMGFLHVYATCYGSLINTWTKNPDLENKLSPVGYNVVARTRLHCSKSCSTSTSCVSFFFVPNQYLNCQLHDVILTSSTELQSVVTSSYYYLDSHAMGVGSIVSCPSDDSVFRTVALNDGTLYTYRILRVLATQSEAILECNALGGFLTRVTTVAKMKMLLLLTKCPGNEEDYYVDGSNAAALNFTAPDAWVMSNGELVPMTPDFWGPGYPNHPNINHCLRMRAHVDYKWDDCRCTHIYYFICEREIGPLSSN